MPKVTIMIDPTGATIVSAYSLKDDAWEDFQFFLKEASALNVKDREKNRALRAAHFNLYAHFEAVVYELGKNALSGKQVKKSLYERCVSIAEVAGIDEISLPGREVRNEITHPSEDDCLPFSVLTKESLEVWAANVSKWLNLACEKLNVQRFSDTKRLVTDFSNVLGSIDEPDEI